MANKAKNPHHAAIKDPKKRKENVRDERPVKDELPKINFSFKDFDRDQIPPGQSFGDWQKKEYLAYLMEKLCHISELNMTEAKQQKYIVEYGNFPANSDFKHPRHIAKDVNWAVIKKIKGQKGRVAGHIIGNTFYIVFLDINHKFWKTDK